MGCKFYCQKEVLHISTVFLFFCIHLFSRLDEKWVYIFCDMVSLHHDRLAT